MFICFAISTCYMPYIVTLYAVHLPRVPATRFKDLTPRDALHLSDGIRHVGDVARMGNPSTEGLGCHVRRIRFQQDTIQRNLLDHVPNFWGIGEGYHTSEAQTQG